ncbi:MAG: DDE-type integrase/transposase/recombinase [Bacillota bacterium]
MTSLKKKDQLGPEVTARLQVQTLHKDRYKVALIAKTLDLNRTYCYSLLQDLPQKERPNKDAEIKQAIIRICIQFPTYGYRRVIAVLRNRSSRAPSTGRKCSGSCRKKASPYRSKNVLRSAPKNQAARSARSNEHFQVDMTKVWCGVRVAGGYLFAVIDAFAREIIGWAFSPRCTTDILLEAVDMALNHRFPHGTRDQNLTIRSDNGCQMFKPNVNALSAARLRHNPRTDRLQQPRR